MDNAANENESLTLTIHHQGTAHKLSFPTNSTLVDLSARLESQMGIPPTAQKFMITPKPGLVKPPMSAAHKLVPLQDLVKRKIILMGSTPAQAAALATAVEKAHAPPPTSIGRTVKAERRVDSKKVQEDALYTFQRLEPLAHMPNPGRSLAFLERLRDDAGIRTAMRKYKYSVPLLTEMDPGAHTTHSYDGVSRTLGLNRNAGQVIELRLRTDAGDGYRDYKTIRRTLCHELAHNEWGDHDANFWKLCREIEGVVERGDWRRGGRTVGNMEFYVPEDGGEESVSREMLARVAEDRVRREREREREDREREERGGL
jgi:hypothetical protein